MKRYRFTWRMYFPVTIDAESPEDATRQALASRPACVPPDTPLYMGTADEGKQLNPNASK